MKTTAIAATFAGGLSSTAVADDMACTKPTAGHDPVQTQFVQRRLSYGVDRIYYWQTITQYILTDSNGDITLATDRLAQQFRADFYHAIPREETPLAGQARPQAKRGGNDYCVPQNGLCPIDDFLAAPKRTQEGRRVGYSDNATTRVRPQNWRLRPR